MEVIPATPEDAVELSSLINLSYNNSREGWTHQGGLIEGDRASPELLKDEMAKPGVFMFKVVDTETSQIIGCVQTEFKNDTVNVGMLCVQPNLQGRGIGKIIIDQVDAFAKKRGCKWSRIVVIGQRKELLEFYQRRGYKLTGEKIPWDNEGVGNPLVPIELLLLKKQLLD